MKREKKHELIGLSGKNMGIYIFRLTFFLLPAGQLTSDIVNVKSKNILKEINVYLYNNSFKS